ncbi:GntR family transcriptional regulator [Micrococcus luteus]|uniref:GntR family transcriptional regulator n=1 Tax=Micrococcus luteus TaxID=1270 RepID=UPI003F4D318A
MAFSTRSTGETMRATGPSAAAPSAAPVAGGAAGVVSTSLPVVAVDGSLPTPPYRQIVDAVLAGVTSGSLARGDRLPPVRALAAELGVAPGTVARAYKELEAHGTIHVVRTGDVLGQGDALDLGDLCSDVGRLADLGLDQDVGLDHHVVLHSVVLSWLRSRYCGVAGRTLRCPVTVPPRLRLAIWEVC